MNGNQIDYQPASCTSQDLRTIDFERRAERRNLDRRLITGVGWSAFSKWGTQIISWASLLVMAKLLSPSDFGLLGMTTLYLGLIGLLSECGIDSTIITMSELPVKVIRQLHTTSVLLGITGSIVALLAAAPISTFFRAPDLRRVISVLGVGLVMSGFRQVPQSLLLRDLRFRTVSLIEASQILLQASSGILLAWFGMGYWSLVFSVLISSAWGTLWALFLRRCGFARPQPIRLRKELTFSWQILVTRLSWYFYSNSDFLVAGRFLGQDALGVYTIAWNIASVPVEKISNVVARVTPSIYAQVQMQSAELRRYIRVLTEGLSMMTFPVGIGLALVAKPLIMTVFDQRWWSSANALRLLALLGVARSISVLLAPALIALKDAKFTMHWTLVVSAVLPVSFVFASRWGSTGIAAAWLCLSPILTLALFWRLSVKTGMQLLEYLGALKPAGLASIAMVVAVLLSVSFMRSVSLAIFKLLVEVLVGSLAYLGFLFAFYRHRLNFFLCHVRTAFHP